MQCQELTKELHDYFKKSNGASCCRILTKGMKKDSPERKEQYIKFVESTVEKVTEIIIREKLQK